MRGDSGHGTPKKEFRRSVTIMRLNNLDQSSDKKSDGSGGIKVNQLVKQSERARFMRKSIDMQYSNLGEFLFRNNEEFRQKTLTCYIVKQGFTYEKIIELHK